MVRPATTVTSASSAEYKRPWLLPGEEVQATFTGHVDFYRIDTRGDPLAFSVLSGSSPSSNDTRFGLHGRHDRDSSTTRGLSSSAHVGRSHPHRASPSAHLASLLTAAGRTLHGKLAQDPSSSLSYGGLPQHHGPHQQHYLHHQSYPGKQHHKQKYSHDGQEVLLPPPSSEALQSAMGLNQEQQVLSSAGKNREGSGSTLVTAEKPPQSTNLQLEITDFRVCLVRFSANGQGQILEQVVLGSIAKMTLQDHDRITITLKFDTSRYLIAQQDSRHGPPVVVTIMTILKTLVFNEQVSTRFPYKMGKAILHPPTSQQQDEDSKTMESRKQGPSLWTAEDIISLEDAGDDSHYKDMSRDKSRAVAQKLGWFGGYDIANEFQRQGFDESLWCVADINADFELSPTYPEQVIMPTCFLTSGSNNLRAHDRHSDPTKSSHGNRAGPAYIALDETARTCLQQLTNFRSNKRFPVLCWRSPDSGLVLMRSSQPMVGFLGARGPEDELYIRTILSSAAKQAGADSKHRTSPKLCIMDARAFASAVANGYVGGGRENPEHYPNASISFMSLGNIHTIANSHQAVLKAVSNQADSPNWFSLIESTGWLNHVADLLKAASGQEGVVGKMVGSNASVLVHCTDGWDRTTQLVSLAQILMDPFFRTIQGLRILIEKEWLSCGHPFQSRTDAVPNGQGRKPGTAGFDVDTTENWKSAAEVQSSPNGAKESVSYSRKMRKNVYPDPDPPKDLEPFPSFTYHMDARQQPVDISSPSATEKSEKSYQETPVSKPTRQMYTGYPPRPMSTPVPPKYPPQQPSTHSSPPTATLPQPGATSIATMVPLSPSPVFILFLTCLHHIVQQHPSQFEFNDYLLIVLARAGSGGLSPFGDFLYNSERERKRDRMRQRTPSIWKWIQRHRGWFTNRDYSPPPPLSSASSGSGSGSHRVMDDWRKNVLTVQTGGRYTALWSEYYFNTTPPFLPDTRTILLHYHPPSPSCPLSEGGTQVSTVYKSSAATTRMDTWHSSMFDEQQRKQFTFPGVILSSKDPMSPGGPRSPPRHDVSSPSAALEMSIILPPELTQLRGEEMHLYYMLVMHLKSKRREKVKNAFLGWQSWAKRRREDRPAREEGWGVVADGFVSGSSSGVEDGGVDTADEELPRSNHRMRKKGLPELVLVAAAKKGVEVEMARIIESPDQFFGRDQPLQYEDISEDEVDYSEEDVRDLGSGQEENDGVKVVQMSDAELEDAFDDFGFPVIGSEDPDVFIAV
ncbi:hypothetical protein EMPS_07282 [Entomortierella parvispora]|uniref:Myotubularin phosphatase domain-containing protein n=1 Tax=Entomortierella parvispora TaxID=205924 RepID=A0A9P3HDZ8_9FUNG|nr:hypothetical protein EMPS_07282 [Entomortierella parvispora]